MNREQRRKSGKKVDPIAALIFSNAPWCGTGYGTQTAQLAERMKKDGHETAISANYGLMGMQSEWRGMPIYPMGYEAYSNDVAAANFAHWRKQNPHLPAHLFVIFDAWVLKGPHWDEMPTSIWTMVDHLPCPPAVIDVLKKPAITPIAVTRWGQQEIERQGVAAEYIPMAIDTKLYKPTDTWEGKHGRELMGLNPDRSEFVVSLVNANKGVPGRKAWGENLLACAIFAKRHDDVRIYIHTERYGNTGGQQLDPLIKAVGLEEHQFRFVNQYANHTGIPNEAMVALYTATDVLLASTYGEGFGLTTLEAAACGTRVIANNFSAQPEMVSEDSWLTDGQPWWDAPQLAWWNIPSVPSIVAALEEAYAKGQSRSQAQIDHAATYDADLIFKDYWRPYLDKIAKAGPTTGPVVIPESQTRSWVRNEGNKDPRLTIYVPTFRRPELHNLLASLAPQIDERVEVIVSDNDPNGFGLSAVMATLDHTKARVVYSTRGANIGGEANILRGYEAGTADWVWIIGDDDTVLPEAVSDVLEAIDHDDLDRLILLSRNAPSNAAGMVGTLAEIAAHEPALPIAATLISANVVRRRAVDLECAHKNFGTMYSHSFALTSCHRVKVLAAPCITVGTGHVNQFSDLAGFKGDVGKVWTELLQLSGVTASDESFRWNFASVA
jgi:hypothetical protein